MNWKWLTLPFSNATKQVQVPQLWEVRWTSRHGLYSSDTRPELEAFTSQEAAMEFARALDNAFKLTRRTGKETHVSVTSAKSV